MGFQDGEGPQEVVQNEVEKGGYGFPSVDLFVKTQYWLCTHRTVVSGCRTACIMISCGKIVLKMGVVWEDLIQACIPDHSGFLFEAEVLL